MNLLQKIVTPKFIALNAHCWFAYAVCYTFPHRWVRITMFIAAGIKEFVIDKHYEVDQTFADNLEDFSGYAIGIALATLAVIAAVPTL